MSQDLLLQVGYFGLLAAVGAITTNRGIAVYHDGLRTLVPELFSGERSRADLARFGWTISVGFILWALPFSLASGIVMIHFVMLTTDVIGIRCRQWWLAALVGFCFGVATSLGVTLFYAAFVNLAAEVRPALDLLWLPLLVSFPLVPFLAVARTFGTRAGLVTLAVSALAWVAVWQVAPSLTFAGWLSGAGVALLAGLLVALAYALRESAEEEEDPAMDELYAPHVARVRRNLVWLAPVGALLALGAGQGWLAGEPLQVALLYEGARADAALVALLSALAFVPLVAPSGGLSGVWNQDGYPDWILGAGYVLPWPLAAAVGGAAVIGAEVLGLRRTLRLLQRKPGISGIASSLRDALDTVPGWALLAGGVMAGHALAGPPGIVAVVGGQALNEGIGRPLIPMTVPPAVVILLGLAVGILA